MLEQIQGDTVTAHAPPAQHQQQGVRFLWKFRHADQQIVHHLAHSCSLSKPIVHTLCARGYDTKEAIQSFLFTTFERDVAHPSSMKDMIAAVARINHAIERKEKILVFGDYDVDGVTSTSILLSSLLPLGADINYFLPNRKIDGYGLSSKAVKRAVASGYKLIVTVDNGISAYEAADDAAALGIDLIITDHHRPHSTVPKALAVVNPAQEDCPYPFKSLAGVGVAFKMASLIYEQRGLTLPDKVYELLMLGTIADVVPLVRENRYWVRYGLHMINQQRSYAMEVLAANSSLTKELFGSLDIGFMIAPQINALGRLDDPREAVKFMISSEAADVDRVGKILKQMNEERKKIDQSIMQDVVGLIERKQINLATENIILAAHHNWQAGVIGLVAGKLMNQYGKPTLLFHLDRDGVTAKGSCRSIPEFDIFRALEVNKDLLDTFGGHTCAAGLKLPAAHLPELKERLENLVVAQVAQQELQPKLQIDASLELPEVNFQLASDIAQLEPFGNQNPQPLFAVRGATLLTEPTLLKEKHVKCMVFGQGVIKPVIFFNRPDLMHVFAQLGERSFDMAAHVVKNEWDGRTSIEFQGLDIAIND